ncbi:MAG: formate dehydrogenase subunit delta [Gammaproteobacteria bacterium]|uniref:formate dehydrogenase subunit delta n=1 Tax=Pseudacidovorax sp. TaxID=1934311 RepID=UPI001B57EF73|nr:formate dehydrogenase subunit delta [Pseudacidovorax sp.]MBP6898193.1 formate dehydrogenase subunit delta [Pseudacidovorax sp.]
MDADNLVRMANRIGDFFAAQPDREEALAGIAEHLKKFWAPRMRADFLAALDADAPALHPLVREAVTAHRAQLAPVARVQG